MLFSLLLVSQDFRPCSASFWGMRVFPQRAEWPRCCPNKANIPEPQRTSSLPGALSEEYRVKTGLKSKPPLMRELRHSIETIVSQLMWCSTGPWFLTEGREAHCLHRFSQKLCCAEYRSSRGSARRKRPNKAPSSAEYQN